MVNDDATALPVSSVTISDAASSATETVTITQTADNVASDANGTLSGTGLTKTGTGIYTLSTDTPAAVTAALRALVFTSTPHEVAPGDTVTTAMTVSISDGSDDALATNAVTTMITAATSVACFAAGTRIGTPRGEVRVENLRVGDLVLTISGQARRVEWIGRRALDCRRDPAPEWVRPVRVAPHTFGENRPKRALLLSPDHSVYVDDVLIPIKFLINGTTIVPVDAATVNYYHLELQQHDVVLAEGLPTEVVP
jgi:hypothetical protein